MKIYGNIFYINNDRYNICLLIEYYFNSVNRENLGSL
jgi:hypothetical protein